MNTIPAARSVHLVLTWRADDDDAHFTRFEGLSERLSDRSFSLAVPTEPDLFGCLRSATAS